MKRTTVPATGCKGEKKIIMVNFYDKNQAQRWGRALKETKDRIIIVQDMAGEVAQVSKDKIIEARECTKEYLNKIKLVKSV